MRFIKEPIFAPISFKWLWDKFNTFNVFAINDKLSGNLEIKLWDKDKI